MVPATAERYLLKDELLATCTESPVNKISVTTLYQRHQRYGSEAKMTEAQADNYITNDNNKRLQ